MSPAPEASTAQGAGTDWPSVEAIPREPRFGFSKGRAPEDRRGKTGRDSASDGEVAEWLKAHAWKVCIRETVSRVRIPLSPPANSIGSQQLYRRLGSASMSYDYPCEGANP